MFDRLEKRRQAMLAMPQMIQEWKEVSYSFGYTRINFANDIRRKDMVVDGRSGQNRWQRLGDIIEVNTSRIVQYHMDCMWQGVKHHIMMQVYIMFYIVYENGLSFTQFFLHSSWFFNTSLF